MRRLLSSITMAALMGLAGCHTCDVCDDCGDGGSGKDGKGGCGKGGCGSHSYHAKYYGDPGYAPGYVRPQAAVDSAPVYGIPAQSAPTPPANVVRPPVNTTVPGGS